MTRTFIRRARPSPRGPAAPIGGGAGPSRASLEGSTWSPSAVLVPAFGRIGLLPEVETSWALTRRVGYQKTFELFAGGRHLSGAEAAELRIANSVHPPTTSCFRPPASGRSGSSGWPRHVTTMMKPLLRAAADASWETAIAMGIPTAATHWFDVATGDRLATGEQLSAPV